MSRSFKINLIMSTIAMLLPPATGLFLWNKLPDSMPIHWDHTGVADRYSSKLFTVVGISAIYILVHVILVLSLISAAKKAGDTSGIALALWLTPIIAILTSAFVYASGMGLSVDTNRAIQLILCIIFGITGVILWRYPSLKIINFPTESIATRRFTGIVLIVSSVLAALLSILGMSYLVPVIAVLCFVIPTVYHFTRGRYIG